MAAKKITPKDVSHIAHLANIPITPEEEKHLAQGFNTTLKVVDTLFTLPAKNIEPTHQVTNLENVFREDEVEPTRMLSQEAALSQAPKTHNGFFVVDQIREEK